MSFTSLKKDIRKPRSQPATIPDTTPDMKGNVTGIAWPPVLDEASASLACLLRYYEASQWWKPEYILEKQLVQLVELAHYACAHSVHFRERMQRAGLVPADLATIEGLRKLPPITRRDIQAAGTSLFSDSVPDAHQPVYNANTSGSTGEPLNVLRSNVTQMFWMASTLREHLWNKRDFSKRMMAIVADVPHILQRHNWGMPVKALFESGSLLVVPITDSVSEQLKHLREFRPDALITYPNNLAGIIDECERQGVVIDWVQHVWTISESLPARLRARAEAFFGTRLQDNYSSTELGIIALQCPGSELYHIMSENILIEVLDEKGKPCRKGKAGKVVGTDLQNFAMPLVRYEIADYAELGGPCTCGRGLPTLKNIRGRSRNLIVMPDGSRHWPVLTLIKFQEIAAIRQFQIIQHDIPNLEIKLFVTCTLSEDEEKILRSRVLEGLGSHFTVQFTYFSERLPPAQNGKFEEFVCLV